MGLSPILLRTVIDKVSMILLGYKYHDINTYRRPTMLERRSKALN